MAAADIGRAFDCVQCGAHHIATRGPAPKTRHCLRCRQNNKSAARVAQMGRDAYNSYLRDLRDRKRQPRHCVECKVEVQGRRQRCEPCNEVRPYKLSKATGSYALRITNAACNQQHCCEGCGVKFKPKRAGRSRFCSRECAFANPNKCLPPERRKVAALRSWEARKRWPRSAVHFLTCKHCEVLFTSPRARMFCPAHTGTEARRLDGVAKRTPLSGSCCECGIDFVRPDTGSLRPSFCSVSCSKRNGKRISRLARKAKQRSVTVESVNPLDVLRRDKWTCQMCGVKTPQRLRGTLGPSAPELDHITPLSRGGEHSYRNTQCLCRSCNLTKGCTEVGQLRLFG
jgi:hypothetical protein